MRQQGSPKISVVVPVYNVEEYLPQCIDSLIAQTLPDIQIVCVNDGSTDGSRKLLEAYSQQDSRIKIVDQVNMGLSAARNSGILASDAPIIAFLDSDDFYAPLACQRICETFEATGADMVTFGAECYPNSGGDEWLEQHLSPRDAVFDGFSLQLMFKENSLPYPRCACSRAFIDRNSLCFDESLRYGEDMLFYLSAYPVAMRVALMSDKIYMYRVRREGSLTADADFSSPETLRKHICVADKVFSRWQQLFDGNQHAADIVHWSVSYVLYGIYCIEDDEQRMALLSEYGHMLACHWSHNELLRIGLGRADLAMVVDAVDGTWVSTASAKKMRLQVSVQDQGVIATAQHLAKMVLQR